MIALAGLAVFVAVAAGGLAVEWACALAAGEFDPADEADVWCPHCDSTDLDDWGEFGWWACRDCETLFEMKP